jgi:hypothetical protein
LKKDKVLPGRRKTSKVRPPRDVWKEVIAPGACNVRREEEEGNKGI